MNVYKFRMPADNYEDIYIAISVTPQELQKLLREFHEAEKYTPGLRLFDWLSVRRVYASTVGEPRHTTAIIDFETGDIIALAR